MNTIIIDTKNSTKEKTYQSLLPQIQELIRNEEDLVANMANIAAALKQTFGFFWVGFYIVKGNELVLGPFQGPVACTRIPFGKGVCGTAWKERRTIVVPDVEQFSGHIACSSESKSEIVVPLFNKNEIIGVLDIDSDRLNTFDETDAEYLNFLCGTLCVVTSQVTSDK
jgi:GAF domain-containing protein